VNIAFSIRVLSNGLRVIFHHEKNSPLAAVNVLYDVGARDEDPERTGFAHLFEHLMFGGSKNIPAFDTPLQKAGGENNAFTSNDITNYYITLPKENIETALWLESDRMFELDFSEKSLDVQRKVVIEEFNQRYLNQPYGDLSLIFRPLCYKVHPYRWSTIGKEISHIAEANLDDVKAFFYKHYNPENAILAISGDFEEEYVFELAEKWFGQIQRPHTYVRNLPQEPEQTEARKLVVERDVPQDCLVMSFPTCNRFHADYYVWDMITDLLSHGNSARLPQALVKEKQIFSDIDAHITGSIDHGQMIVRGDVLPGVSIEDAEIEVWKELEKLKNTPVSEAEMTKMKNQIQTSNIFRNVGILNKTMNLAYFAHLGDAQLINTEVDKYLEIDSEKMQAIAKNNIVASRSSVLYYKSKK